MASMDIRYLSVNDLRPYSKNTKKHDSTQIANVAESIRQYGFVQPIVIDKNNVVVIGHCRLLAAKKLKMETVPCLYVDALTDEQVNALRVIDNKTNESPWDMELLPEELKQLDLSGFAIDWGFDDDGEDFDENNQKPEVEFTEVLEECHNYIVLYFDNDIDWIQAQGLFGIKQVKALSTRKDGVLKESAKRIGVGRVINGADAINKILGDTK